jgi:hypothetical protein
MSTLSVSVAREIPLSLGGNTQPEPTFWQGVKNTASRVWTVITDKATLLFETISAIFFSALEYISPSLANKASMAWGWLTRTWMRVDKSFSDEQFKQQIAELQAKNRELADQCGQSNIAKEQAENAMIDLKGRAETAEAAASKAQAMRDECLMTSPVKAVHQKHQREQLSSLKEEVATLRTLVASLIEENAQLKVREASPLTEKASLFAEARFGSTLQTGQ